MPAAVMAPILLVTARHGLWGHSRSQTHTHRHTYAHRCYDVYAALSERSGGWEMPKKKSTEHHSRAVTK